MSNLLASYARHPMSKPLAALINALLAASIVYVLTRFLWLALDWNSPLPSAGPAVVPEAAQPPPPSLSNWHVFGNATVPVDQRALANAPETQLPIDLRGVLAGEDPKRGRAFIADANGERGFNVGQEVAPGVVLDAVYADRVALSRGGAIEMLKLRAPVGAAAQVPTAASGTSPRAVAITPVTAPGIRAPMTTANAPIDRTLFGQVTASNLPMHGVDMEKVKQQLGVDPTTLANQITPLPVMENGKLVGVRLNAGPHAAVLAKLGLQPEDVVTAINGVAVTDPSRIGAAVAGLAQASRVEVQVRRNGQSHTLTVDLPR